MMKLNFAFLLTFCCSINVLAQYEVGLVEVADGFDSPTEIVHAGDERIFILEKKGLIKIMYPDGTVEPEPFLDIQNRVESEINPEMGLSGLAFPPDYCDSGVFYIYYTGLDDEYIYSVFSKFTVDPDDPDHAISSSEEILIQFDHTYYTHNSGHMEFGPDGYLYLAVGDGAGGGDPPNNGQDTSTLLGSILRLDVVGMEGYSIPPDNPFVGNPDARDEIYVHGFRNPWKFAFDPADGGMYIGDVGQDQLEEVSYLLAGENAGGNFGWRCYEGSEEYNFSLCDDIDEDNLVFPVFEYFHGTQPSGGFACSITGGRVYRGNSFDKLQGKYIFMDYCAGSYWLLWKENGDWQNFQGGFLDDQIVSFGEDVWGEMYAADNAAGTILRVEESSGELRPHIIQVGEDSLMSALEGQSYQWYLDGELVEGQSSQKIVMEASGGNYQVLISTGAGCEVASKVVGFDGYDQGLPSEFSAYPNPAGDIINFKFAPDSTLKKPFKLSFLNVEGKLQAERLLNFNSGEEVQIQVADLANGMYIIQFESASGQVFRREKMIIR